MCLSPVLSPKLSPEWPAKVYLQDSRVLVAQSHKLFHIPPDNQSQKPTNYIPRLITATTPQPAVNFLISYLSHCCNNIPVPPQKSLRNYFLCIVAMIKKKNTQQKATEGRVCFRWQLADTVCQGEEIMAAGS